VALTVVATSTGTRTELRQDQGSPGEGGQDDAQNPSVEEGISASDRNHSRRSGYQGKPHGGLLPVTGAWARQLLSALLSGSNVPRPSRCIRHGNAWRLCTPSFHLQATSLPLSPPSLPLHWHDNQLSTLALSSSTDPMPIPSGPQLPFSSAAPMPSGPQLPFSSAAPMPSGPQLPFSSAAPMPSGPQLPSSSAAPTPSLRRTPPAQCPEWPCGL